MSNIIKSHSFVFEDQVYEARVTKELDGVEVQVYHEGVPVEHFASEFIGIEIASDLAASHNISIEQEVEDMVYSTETRVREYHERRR